MMQQRFPTDEELRALGIDPTKDAHRIHNGPEFPLSSLHAQIDQALALAGLFTPEERQPSPKEDKPKPA